MTDDVEAFESIASGITVASIVGISVSPIWPRLGVASVSLAAGGLAASLLAARADHRGDPE